MESKPQPSTKGKFLVIGQGLAGSLLALELHRVGAKFDIVEAGLPYSASKVAAGIINPITGKRLAYSWEFEKFKAFAAEHYVALEKQLGSLFYQETRMLRLFRDEKERSTYQKRLQQDEFKPWLGKLNPPGKYGKALHDPQGSFEIHGTAMLDTFTFLKDTRNWLENQGNLREKEFFHSDLTQEASKLGWKGKEYVCAIFCEGYRIQQNPWFCHCPMEMAAGEIQAIQPQSPLPEGMINAGKWLRPSKRNSYLAGATYSWEELESPPAPQGLSEMQEGLGKLLKEPYQLLDRQTGIRPVAKDRKPILGRHPQKPALAIFNGLGSKGSLMAPLLAKNLVQHLLQGEELLTGTDVRRFS